MSGIYLKIWYNYPINQGRYTMLESIKDWWEKARRARETRKAYQALNSFSDRQLLDIGLTRAEIYAKVFDVTKIRESGW